PYPEPLQLGKAVGVLEHVDRLELDPVFDQKLFCFQATGLQRGGADVVVSPYITGGKRMAAAALRPQVMDFVDGILTGTNRTFYMEEFLIAADSCPYVGQTLREAHLRSKSGALVLAIRHTNGELTVGPTANTRLMPGDFLICMGTDQQLRRLNQILSPIRSRHLRAPREDRGG
ncbi:MAG: TrkA family potassium uptake protein, partial [Cyanothece sp. SIO1E1]|nr:TrkA family potassium uptake protein [Cyanothece sp. SIO1E1]